MNTEFYLETQPVDISEDVSALLTFAIDDIKDFSERSTTWSKTIVLPGTSNNNKLLGHIFQAGQANEYNPASPNYGYNFNASKSAACIMFQDNIQAFKGVLRLLQINIDKGRIEYEVSVFGDLFSLNVELASSLLTDLDFSAYDHVYNESNIVGSWDNTPGSGYYYPLLDYGNYSVEKHDWDIRTFRPALYVKQYIDKMFAFAGFRYQSDLFETTRFKRLIIPHNQAKIFSSSPSLLEVEGVHTEIPTTADRVYMEFPTVINIGDFELVANSYFYRDTPTYSASVRLRILGSYASNVDLFLVLEQNGTKIIDIDLPPSAGAGISIDEIVNITLAQDDSLTAYLIAAGSIGEDLFFFVEYDTLSLKVDVAGGLNTELSPGGTVNINALIPQNIRQIDFLVSIVKLFNLYIYEDRFDNRLINIKPYVDFYSNDSSNSVDWTYKLNRNGVINIKPMSEINSKLYKFNYKDDADYYNDLYKKRYGQGYGSYIFDSLFEFASEENSLELIFSPTPLVGYDGEDKVYPTICKVNNADNPAGRTEENIDSNIRILQTKNIAGVESWDILNGDTVLDSLTTYGYAGHLDDPDSPSNDLNFGALKELFFLLTAGTLSNTQFNIYWSPYMAEITDKDSKVLSAEFHLKPSDIFSLDFSKYIVVEGVLFRLNKIIDYNASQPSLCKAELLKVINTIY